MMTRKELFELIPSPTLERDINLAVEEERLGGLDLNSSLATMGYSVAERYTIENFLKES